MIKTINRVYKKRQATPAAPTPDQQRLTEICDLLANQARQDT